MQLEFSLYLTSGATQSFFRNINIITFIIFFFCQNCFVCCLQLSYYLGSELISALRTVFLFFYIKLHGFQFWPRFWLWNLYAGRQNSVCSITLLLWRKNQKSECFLTSKSIFWPIGCFINFSSFGASTRSDYI